MVKCDEAFPTLFGGKWDTARCFVFLRTEGQTGFTTFHHSPDHGSRSDPSALFRLPSRPQIPQQPLKRLVGVVILPAGEIVNVARTLSVKTLIKEKYCSTNLEADCET